MEKLFQLDNSTKIDDAIQEKYEQIVQAPYLYIHKTTGKQFRKTVLDLYSHLIEVDEEQKKFISEIIQLMHTCSIVIDDVQDSANLRRGAPSAHIIFGIGSVILAAGYTMNIIYNMSDTVEFSSTTLAIASNLVQGQSMEIYWRDNGICPTEDEYLDMSSKKCGTLFVGLFKYMKLCSSTTINLTRLSMLIGTCFQIVDDYKGLQSLDYYSSKGFCDDIREGKFTFPIIHGINCRLNDNRILDILKLHTNDDILKLKCLALLEEFGSLEYTRKKLKYYKDLIMEEFGQYGNVEHLKKIFQIMFGNTSFIF